MLRRLSEATPTKQRILRGRRAGRAHVVRIYVRASGGPVSARASRLHC